MEEGEPSWLKNNQQQPPAQATTPAPAANTPTTQNRAIQMAITILNLGLMVMVSATGAIAMQGANNINDTGIIFVSFYLILFAAVLGIHELINLTPEVVHSKLDYWVKLNFGFLYTVYGKSCYEMFIGILIFALAQNEDFLALPTAILVVAWAVAQVLLYLKFPEWFTNLATYQPSTNP